MDYNLKFHNSQSDAEIWADSRNLSIGEFNRIIETVEGLDFAHEVWINEDWYIDDEEEV